MIIFLLVERATYFSLNYYSVAHYISRTFVIESSFHECIIGKRGGDGVCWGSYLPP